MNGNDSQTGTNGEGLVRDRPPVLVVHTDDGERTAIVCDLESLGCAVTAAGDPADALAMLTDRRFDLVVVDAGMPASDGFDLTRDIRQLSGIVRSVPVVIIAAADYPDAQQRCLVAGVDDWYGKPVGRDDLAAVLERWLPYARQTGADAPTAPPCGVGQLPPGAEAHVDRVADATGLPQEDVEDLLVVYFDAMLADAAYLRAALDAGDAEAAIELGHKMKGSAGNFSMFRTTRLCAAVEAAARENPPDFGSLAGLVNELVAQIDSAQRYRPDDGSPPASGSR